MHTAETPLQTHPLVSQPLQGVFSYLYKCNLVLLVLTLQGPLPCPVALTFLSLSLPSMWKALYSLSFIIVYLFYAIHY